MRILTILTLLASSCFAQVLPVNPIFNGSTGIFTAFTTTPVYSVNINFTDAPITSTCSNLWIFPNLSSTWQAVGGFINGSFSYQLVQKTNNNFVTLSPGCSIRVSTSSFGNSWVMEIQQNGTNYQRGWWTVFLQGGGNNSNVF